MEIESRVLPCGLHIVGIPPTADEAVATLVSIGEIDRPSNDPPVKGLPGVFAAAVGRGIEEIYRSSDKGKLADVDLLQRITDGIRCGNAIIVCQWFIFMMGTELLYERCAVHERLRPRSKVHILL